MVSRTYRYMSWYHLTDDVVMMETKADVRHIQGINHQERTQCPRKAQHILHRYVSEKKQRGILYRDGVYWVILAGPDLGLSSSVAADADMRSVHYMRQGSPHVVQSTTDPMAGGLDQLVAVPNSAIHPTALLTDVMPVQRFVELPSALERNPPSLWGGLRPRCLEQGRPRYRTPVFIGQRTKRPRILHHTNPKGSPQPHNDRCDTAWDIVQTVGQTRDTRDCSRDRYPDTTKKIS